VTMGRGTQSSSQRYLVSGAIAILWDSSASPTFMGMKSFDIARDRY